MKLETLVEQLKGAYGSSLKAVILYGSAVAGEHITAKSDYNVIVIVDGLTLDKLQSASSIARAWRDAGNPPPMTFTTDEWRDSSDIFPMEYSDILDRHKMLYGDESILQGIGVSRDDLRLQVEHQATGKLLALRQGALLAGTEAKRQLELMEESLSTIMVICRAVVRLAGEVPPTDYEELVTQVARISGVQPHLFTPVIRHLRGTPKLGRNEAAGVLAGYLSGVEKLATYVNQC